jgi:hypothetical protein
MPELRQVVPAQVLAQQPPQVRVRQRAQLFLRHLSLQDQDQRELAQTRPHTQYFVVCP